MPSYRHWSVAFVGCLIFFAGCGSSESDGPLTQDEKNLQVMARMLGMYGGQHEGQGPASDQQFIEWLKSLPQAQREGMDVKNPDGQFVSTRDGQPFQIVPNRVGQGIPLELPGSEEGGATAEVPIEMVAHEKTGKDGVRLVVDVVGVVHRLDEAAFQKALARAKQNSPSGNSPVGN